MPRPGTYYANGLEAFNRPDAPSIDALTQDELKILAEQITKGLWATATMGEKTKLMARHPDIGRALKYEHEVNSASPVDKFLESLGKESRDARIEREGRQTVEVARQRLRERGLPGSLAEARLDPSGLLAAVDSKGVGIKSDLYRLPEAEKEAMTQLANGYRSHLEKLREQAQTALDKANQQLGVIERRSAEINALLDPLAQPPTDDDAPGAAVPV